MAAASAPAPASCSNSQPTRRPMGSEPTSPRKSFAHGLVERARIRGARRTAPPRRPPPPGRQHARAAPSSRQEGGDRHHFGDGHPVEPVHEVDEVHEPDPGRAAERARSSQRGTVIGEDPALDREQRPPTTASTCRSRRGRGRQAAGCRRPRRRGRAPRRRPRRSTKGASGAPGRGKRRDGDEQVLPRRPRCRRPAGSASVWLERAFGRASA